MWIIRTWKSAAPLKLREAAELKQILINYPHLKKCGPIEAWNKHKRCRQASYYPHLKKCGPIEALRLKVMEIIQDLLSALEKVRPHWSRADIRQLKLDIFNYPHLKKCGPIEAGYFQRIYWRSLSVIRTWKSAAPLKHLLHRNNNGNDIFIRTWKSAAPLKQYYKA